MKMYVPQWLRHRRPIVLFLLAQFLTVISIAQVKVTGRITGPDGAALPGISVAIRNTNAGTATDVNGNYTLSSDIKPGNYQIVFSGIGFKSYESALKVNTNSNYTINAAMTSDALGLDEVIVTGTSQGTTRRQLGSYISTVKGEELANRAAGKLLAALQGKTAGAQIIQNSGDPGGGISVRLRGISSVNSSSEPLYIVDGVIVNNATTRVTNTSGNYDGSNFVGNIGQNRLADINPADIERIEVLNGAAAAAIYGSRANAGVVQIFTKRGASGAPVVSFSTNIMVNDLRKKVGVNNAPVKFGGSPDVFTQDIITTVGTPAALVTTTSPVQRYDYQDYIFHTGLGTDNNASVSGGTDKTKYYVSGSYFFNQGIVRNTDFRRYSFRSNIDQIINDKLSFTIGLNYVNSASNEKPDGNSFFSPLNSINILGNFHDIFTRDALGNIKAVGERQRINPVSVIEDIKQREETNRVIANAGLKWKPIKNLSLDYTLGIDNYSQNGKTYIPPFAYAANTAFYGGGLTLDPTQNGYSSTANSTYFQINHEINATYQVNISANLASTSQIGYSLQYEKSSYMLLQGRGLAPLIETVTGASTRLDPADARGELSISGAYFQQNFKYKNQFFVTGAVRVDGSSVFGKDQRNQVYLKGSGSYVLSGTDLWTGSSLANWWDLFKLRVAYGQSGNLTGIGPYDRFNGYSSIAFLGKTSFYSSSSLANTNVQPERQTELEFGTDLAFFQSRVGVQFNYYIKKVDHLLINRVIAPTTGFSSLLDNLGSLENKGYEVVLNLVPVKGKDFNWNLTGIYNHNRNKAVRIGQALTLISTNAGAPVAILEGQPIGIFYGTFFSRDAGGNQLKNASGIPLTELGIQNSPLSYTAQKNAAGLPSGSVLRKVVGDPNPDYTASLVNEFSYKKLNLRVQLDAVQGVDVWNADWRTRQGVGNGKVAEQEDKGEVPRGFVAGNYNIEEWRIDDGSFVKLREVSLGYSFGKIKNVFSALSVSLSGRNLISWDKYKGYDPEVNAGGQSTVWRGIDFGAVPVPRTFAFGIQAKF